VQRRQSREPAADVGGAACSTSRIRRSRAITLVVGLAQFIGDRDRQGAHQVLHVEPIGARVRTLPLREPGFLFAD
jgi:hypothetical protein